MDLAQTTLATFAWNCDFYRHLYLMCNQFKLLQPQKTQSFYLVCSCCLFFHSFSASPSVPSTLSSVWGAPSSTLKELPAVPSICAGIWPKGLSFVKQGGREVHITTENSARTVGRFSFFFFFSPQVCGCQYAKKKKKASGALWNFLQWLSENIWFLPGWWCLRAVNSTGHCIQ